MTAFFWWITCDEHHHNRWSETLNIIQVVSIFYKIKKADDNNARKT